MSALSPQILFVNLLFYIFCSSMPLGKERIESDSEVSDRNSLKPPSTKESKSRAQRFEDVLGILREGCISPFDLVIKLLDDSNSKYLHTAMNFTKKKTKSLMKFLILFF